MGSLLILWTYRGKLVFRGLALVLIGCLALVGNLIGTPAYPLKASANRRYLVDRNNNPFLMIGDAPHTLIAKVTTADAALYLRNRASYGINTLWVELLCSTYVNGRPDGSLVDGTVPFTNTLAGGVYDLTAPNEAYFAHVDTIIRMAATNGIQLLLDSLETGDWTSVALVNGSNRCRSYGQYLGQRYKDFTNVIWITGNDFQTWRIPTNDAVVTAVAFGIKDRDTNHLHTVELDYEVSESLDDPNWWPIISLNGVYTTQPTYAESLSAYNRTNFVPVFLLEAHYEFEALQGEMGTLNVLRRQEYWSLLGGANGGYIGGNSWTWRLSSGWQAYINSIGVAHLQHMNSLFEIRRWYDLIPDYNHAIITSGYGTFQTFGNVSDSDYATAAATSDGRLAMCYVPTGRTINVDMTKMAGTTVARWSDPTSGSYIAANGSPFANTGARAFTTPGVNFDGDTDWVLVLETQPPETQPPTVTITAPSTAARVSGIVAVSATASDNVGVVGVQFQVDGVNLGPEVKALPYSTAWNTLNVTNGAHNVQAVARDLAGNRNTNIISVTVSNALPPSAGPVAAYSFNESSGRVVADVSGNGNAGTITGAARTTTARNGSALSFSGSDFVTVSDSDSLDLSNGVTLEAWVYPTEGLSDWGTIVLKEVPGNMAYGLLLYTEGGLIRPEMYVRSPAGTLRGVQGQFGLPLNVWTHIAGTYDGVNVQLYVNGYVNRNQMAAAGVPDSIGASAEPLRIGGNSIWGEYFRGAIDEVRIYNRGINQKEIQRDMVTPLTPPSVSILSPADGSTFRAGDLIQLSGSAVDPQDGELPPGAFSWSVLFHQNGETHPVTMMATGKTGSFVIPLSGTDFQGATSYEIALIGIDSDGLRGRASVTIFPQKVALLFDTAPTGLLLGVAGIQKVCPFVIDALIGMQYQINAPAQVKDNTRYQFVSWSDGGPQGHALTVPQLDAAYVAVFMAPGNLDIVTSFNGHVRLRFTGIAGRVCRIQASVNLQAWRTIASAVVAAGGTFDFEDTDTGYSHRFYRCVTP